MRLFIGDHMMCSEFMRVGRYLYQLLVVSGTIVLVVISPVSYFRCQILVVSYSVVRYQLPVVRLLVIIDITSCWRYQLLFNNNSYYCLLIKDTITRGTGVIA